MEDYLTINVLEHLEFPSQEVLHGTHPRLSQVWFGSTIGLSTVKGQIMALLILFKDVPFLLR